MHETLTFAWLRAVPCRAVPCRGGGGRVWPEHSDAPGKRRDLSSDCQLLEDGCARWSHSALGLVLCPSLSAADFTLCCHLHDESNKTPPPPRWGRSLLQRSEMNPEQVTAPFNDDVSICAVI
jgi:hypothetical protein